jgi:hypothetical protein
MPWLNAGQLVIWSDELLLVRRLFLLFTLVTHFSICRSIYQFCTLRPNSGTKFFRVFLLLFTHCKQDPIYVFLEMKLRGLVPYIHIHVSVHLFCCSKIGAQIVGIYKLLTDT